MGYQQGERVRFELLGRFHAIVGNRVVPEAAWPSRRSAELVQLLALTDRHWLLREQAIEALWPQLDPEAGAANLRKAAHHARQALGQPAAVELAGGRVVLFPQTEVETDVACFEQWAETAPPRTGRRGLRSPCWAAPRGRGRGVCGRALGSAGIA